MSEIDINKLWDEVINFGYTIRKLMLIMDDKDFNIGKTSWSLLKDNFKEYKFKNNDTRKITDTIFISNTEEKTENKIGNIKIKYNHDETDNIIIYKIDSRDTDHEKVKVTINTSTNSITLDNTIEYHHFFIQHFRIIIKENYKINVQKLMQIAFNIGQYKAHSELKPKDYEGVTEFYKKNKLDKINTYIGELKYSMVKQEHMTGGYDYCYFKFNFT